MPSEVQVQPEAPRANERGERQIFAPAPPGYRKGEPEPIGSMRGWITPADYPAESWRIGEQGIVQYELAVDASGVPTDCTITYTNVSEALTAHTCALLKERGRFRPARDADGNAISATVPGEQFWVIRGPDYAESIKVSTRFIIDEQGRPQDCEIVEVTDYLPDEIRRGLERDPCIRGMAGAPYRDASGVPIAKQITVTLMVDVEDAPDPVLSAPVAVDRPPIVMRQGEPDAEPYPVTELPSPAPPTPPMARVPAPPPPYLARPARLRGAERLGQLLEFPLELMFLGEAATTRVRLEVGTNGRAAGCQIVGSSGFALLDQQTCDDMKRYARFEPARDADGKPTVGSFTQPIVWRIEEDEDLFTAHELDWLYPGDAREQKIEGVVGISFRVDPQGKVSGCTITRSSGSYLLDEATCKGAMRMSGSRVEQTGSEPIASRSVEREVSWSLSDYTDEEESHKEGDY